MSHGTLGMIPTAQRADRPRPPGPMSVTANSTPKEPGSPREPGLRRAAQSGLDVMLTDAVFEGGRVGRFLKPRAAGRTIAGLARHPRRTARDAGRFGIELARVAAGSSEARPTKGDRRFGERAWQDNWLLRRVMQSYLVTCETVDRLISDAGVDWRTERQARFAAEQRARRAGADELPLVQPGGAEGEHRRRRSEPGERRHGVSCATSPARRTFPPASM